VNGQFYLGIMERLLKWICRVRPEFHNSKEWSLLHDNAPAHTVGVVVRFLARKQVTVLHHPSYLPDLAPANFFLFPKLKSQLKAKRFQDISIIQANVTEQIRSIPKDSFKKSFQSLYEHCKSCIDRQGDYVYSHLLVIFIADSSCSLSVFCVLCFCTEKAIISLISSSLSASSC
jgi:hypothetical protein